MERPQGIVKELVENWYRCTRIKYIEIQISQGGIATITIIDDGDGMDPVDATLAFDGATSKLGKRLMISGIYIQWDFSREALRLPSHLFLRTAG